MCLKKVLTQELGPPDTIDGKFKWLCPFHDDTNPSLTIYTYKEKEKWKCFGCGKGGDVLDLLRYKYSLSYTQAKARLLSLLQAPKESTQEFKNLRNYKNPAAKVKFLGSPPSWWRLVVEGGSERIWRAPQALSWLRDRGLNDSTIRQARLAIHEEGIAIPWFSFTGGLLAINIRRDREPKYRLLKGSAKGISYPDAPLDYRKPVLLCEGEFDTLLVRQEAGDLVQALTLGSAADRPNARLMTHLTLCRQVLVAFDADNAGDGAYQRFKAVLSTAKRVRPPEGMDLTNVHSSASGGVRSWLANNLPSAS